MLHWGAGRRFVRWRASDTPASRLIAAMTVPPDATRTALINTTFTALAPILPSLDLLFVTAAHDAQAARLNWVSPSFAPLIAANSPTFTVDRGYQGDAATSGLATTGANMSVLANYRQDDANSFAWSLTDGTSALADFGQQGGGNFFILRNVSNNQQSRLNTSGTATVANPGAIGFFGASRNNSADYQHYKNGAALGTAQAAVSTAVVAQPFSICRAGAQFSTRQIAAAGAGKALTAGDWTTLYNALLPYMQGVGAA